MRNLSINLDKNYIEYKIYRDITDATAQLYYTHYKYDDYLNIHTKKNNNYNGTIRSPLTNKNQAENLFKIYNTWITAQIYKTKYYQASTGTKLQSWQIEISEPTTNLSLYNNTPTSRYLHERKPTKNQTTQIQDTATPLDQAPAKTTDQTQSVETTQTTPASTEAQSLAPQDIQAETQSATQSLEQTVAETTPQAAAVVA